ncbi:MAG TPA: ABC transporter substrate-binding protein [Candidatus Limnocylindria bacterium]|jgi:putative hydroxymethylpyrimidine transport system substrate-binding protein
MVSSLGRRAFLKGAAAVALASCAPTTTSGATPGASSSKALVPFKWLFGFTISAGADLPVVIARELGYYKEQGLDFSWDFTTDSTGIRLIGTGQYQAGSVSDAAAPVNYIVQGIPLKVIDLMTQRGARALAVKKGSGISRPKDFEGKKVGIKTSPWSEYLVMLASDKVDRTKITEVPVGFSSVELKDGLVDVLPVFTGNEPYVLKNQLNTDVDLLLPDQFGYPPIGTSTVVNAGYAKSNPAEVTGFLRATLKGAEYMVAHKAESVQIAVQYAGPGKTREQHEFQYDVTARDLVSGIAATKGIGYVTPAQWQAQLDLLADLKVITSKPKVEDVLDTSFLDKVLKDGKVVWPG